MAVRRVPSSSRTPHHAAGTAHHALHHCGHSIAHEPRNFTGVSADGVGEGGIVGGFLGDDACGRERQLASVTAGVAEQRWQALVSCTSPPSPGQDGSTCLPRVPAVVRRDRERSTAHRTPLKWSSAGYPGRVPTPRVCVDSLDLGYTTARMGCDLDVCRHIRPACFGQYAAMLAPTKNPA